MPGPVLWTLARNAAVSYLGTARTVLHTVLTVGGGVSTVRQTVRLPDARQGLRSGIDEKNTQEQSIFSTPAEDRHRKNDRPSLRPSPEVVFRLLSANSIWDPAARRKIFAAGYLDHSLRKYSASKTDIK